MRVLRSSIKNLFASPNLHDIEKYGLSILIGFLMGFGIVFFHYLLNHLLTIFYSFVEIKKVFYNMDVLYELPTWGMLIPVLGITITSAMVHYTKTQRPLNINLIVYSYHQRDGKMTLKETLMTFITTFTTVGFGSPTGIMGPIGVISAGLSSLIGQWLKIGQDHQRMILLLGFAGGVGAILKSPFGAAILVVESLYRRDMEFKYLVPCLISSSISYLVYGFFYDFTPLFKVSSFVFNPGNTWIYLLMGVYCVAISRLHLTIFRLVGKLYGGLKWHRIVKGFSGGIFFVIIGFMFPSLFNLGTLNMSEILLGNIPYEKALFLSGIFLLLAVLKILVFSVYVQSNGGVGGTFAPALNVGGFTGASFGSLMIYLLPNQFDTVVPFVLIAMCAFYSGISRTTIGIIVIFLEITGNVQMLPAFLLVSLITVMFIRKGIYTEQLDER